MLHYLITLFYQSRTHHIVTMIQSPSHVLSKGCVDLKHNRMKHILVVSSATNNHNTILRLPDEILGLALSFLSVGHYAFIALVCSRFKIAYLAHVSDDLVTTGDSFTSSMSRAKNYLEGAGREIEKIALFWRSAARYGRLEVMEWAHQHEYSFMWQTVNWEGQEDLRLEVMELVREHDEHRERLEVMEFGSMFRSQARIRDLALKKRFFAAGWRGKGHYGKDICRIAAEHGQHDTSQWLIQKGCECSISNYVAAARK